MNYYHSPVYIKLSEYLFCCRKSSVYVNIALVMLQKITEFPAVYIEEIALLANTTRPVRLGSVKSSGIRVFRC